MKIILSKKEIEEIIKNWILECYSESLDINSIGEIEIDKELPSELLIYKKPQLKGKKDE